MSKKVTIKPSKPTKPPVVNMTPIHQQCAAQFGKKLSGK